MNDNIHSNISGRRNQIIRSLTTEQYFWKTSPAFQRDIEYEIGRR